MTHPAHWRNGRLIDMANVTRLLTELSQRPMTFQEIQHHVGVSRQTAWRLIHGMRTHLKMDVRCEGHGNRAGQHGRYTVKGWGILDRRAFVRPPLVTMGRTYVIGCEDDCAPD